MKSGIKGNIPVKPMFFVWETILQETTAKSEFITRRAKVQGGWLVKEMIWLENKEHRNENIAHSMVFIPDPDHEWKIS